MLARYNFYYERFLNSQAALEKAELRLKDLREKLTALIFEIYEVTYTDAHFLEDAILEMIHSRIVLKWQKITLSQDLLSGLFSFLT